MWTMFHFLVTRLLNRGQNNHCHCNDAECLFVFTALVHEGLLSVVNISDDGMSILKPVEITDTHVIVKVPHFSSFGLVWALEIVGRIWNFMKPVSGQVLLFLRSPNVITQKQNINVHLLPINIPLEEVKIHEMLQPHSYIRYCPGQEGMWW